MAWRKILKIEKTEVIRETPILNDDEKEDLIDKSLNELKKLGLYYTKKEIEKLLDEAIKKLPPSQTTIINDGGAGVPFETPIKPGSNILIRKDSSGAYVVSADLGSYVPNSFETVSKNLRVYPYALTYTGDTLSYITYTTPTGTIVKTFNWTGSQLDSIVLSGDTPSGISLTKTLTWSGSTLSSVAYS